MTFEKDLERKLVAGVKARGGRSIKIYGVSHWPDRIVLAPGPFLAFVEMKAPGVTPRKGQLHVHEMLRGWGFRVEVIDDETGINTLLAEIPVA